MPVLLILLLAVVTELAVLVWVGGLVGFLPTVGLLLGLTLLGGFLLKREGVRALGALQQAVVTRRVPDKEVVDGMLIAAAAVFVLLPGLVSDAVALSLLFPPTRSLYRRWLVNRASARAGVVQSIVVDSERVDPTVMIIDSPQDGDRR